MNDSDGGDPRNRLGPLRAVPMQREQASGGPVRRPEVLQSVRHWHKGKENRTTRELEPWRAIVVTHLESGRELRQFDVRPDDDDADLAQDIDMAIDAHGGPLATKSQTTQTYQIDCYFGNSVSPGGNCVVDVAPRPSMDNFGKSMLAARGTQQDFAQQDFRHREMMMSSSFGLVRFNVEMLVEQLDRANTRIRVLEEREERVAQREREVADAEHYRKMELVREEASQKRKDFVVAKLARYLPILAARIDRKLLGIAQTTPEERESKATEVVKSILGKLKNDDTGAEKLAKITAILDLSEKDQQRLQEIGIMMWLDEEREKLRREAEMSANSGGFFNLGKDITEMQQGKEATATATKKE